MGPVSVDSGEANPTLGSLAKTARTLKIATSELLGGRGLDPRGVSGDTLTCKRIACFCDGVSWMGSVL